MKGIAGIKEDKRVATYRVRIILDEIEVEAETEEEANEIATDVLYGDASTHLAYGLSIIDFETELEE